MGIFAERLRKTLEANKISQSELARRIKMSQDSVNKYCTGKHEPSLDTLRLICKEIDETADYLIGSKD